MQVFVTGATGFLGLNIVERMLEDGFEITALLLPHDPGEGLPEKVNKVCGNITDPNSLIGLLAGHDAVLHLAGAVGYGQTWDTCIRLNREGTRNVAVLAVAENVRRFVHLSSVSVYGRVWGVPVDEGFPHRKIKDPYGDTKIDAECILLEHAQNNELDLTMIRPTMIYGPGDVLFLPKVVENLKTGSARIIGKGDHPVDVIHVSDVAEFIVLVLNEPKAIGRTYNLTHPDNPTWKEMLVEVARMIDVNPPQGHIPYPAAYAIATVMELLSRLNGKPPRLTRYAVRNVGRPYHYVTDRMRDELGFTPQIKLLDGLRECLEKRGDA
jgi:nucleoside-diphosphate-sugar epimerase